MRFHPKRAGAVVAALALGLAALAVGGTAQASTARYNDADSVATGYHHRAFDVAFQVDQVYTSTLTADNAADALSTHCHGCRSVAIAFQVVADGRVPTGVYASNYATSVNDSCVDCQTLGVAYQFIVAKPVVLSFRDRMELARVEWRLWSLEWSGAPVADVSGQVDALAGQVASILAGAGSGGHWPWIYRHTTWRG